MVLEHSSLFVQILFFGAPLSAIQFSSSYSILAPSTVIVESLIRPSFPEMSARRLLYVMRLSVVGVAICAGLMAASSQNIYDLVAQSSALSLVSLFVPLTAGLYWKRASNIGALAAIIIGMAAWLICEWQATAIPSLIYGGLSSWLGMLLGSWLWPNGPKNVRSNENTI